MDFQFSEHPLYQKPPLDPFLEICWQVAEKAHTQPVLDKHGNFAFDAKGDIATVPSYREKAVDVQIPVLTHPQMGYRILRSAGVEDRITLGAELLHDVVEDYCLPRAEERFPEKGPYEQRQEAFKDFSGTMKQRLLPYFQKLHPGNDAMARQDTENAVHALCEVVRGATNESERHEGKSVAQATQAQKYSWRVANVKMADHAASMICDILVPPEEAGKAGHFADKALDVAEACGDHNRTLYYLIKKLRHDVRKIFDPRTGPGLREEFQRNFDIDIEMAKAREQATTLGETGIRPQRAMTWHHHPDAAHAHGGIVSYGIDDGQAVAFRTLVKLNAGENHHLNKASKDLRRAINDDTTADGLYHHAGIGDFAMTEDGRMVRESVLEYPMPVNKLLAHAVAAKAIDPAFAKAISAATPQTIVKEPVPELLLPRELQVSPSH